MIQALIGKKIGQTQKFLQNGTRIPVTQVAVPNNSVMQIKNMEKDGYIAVQLGFGQRKHSTKSLTGHVKKAGKDKTPVFFKEVKMDGKNELPTIGEEISLESVFESGDVVNVSGTSKGKGFAGGVKRYHFRGGPRTHGQSDRERAPGSVGQTTTPGRVYRGKRMAGRMGHEIVTLQNLEIVAVDVENKRLSIKGLVPGVKDSIVFIEKVGKNKKALPLYVKEEVKPEIKEPAIQEVNEGKEEAQNA